MGYQKHWQHVPCLLHSVLLLTAVFVAVAMLSVQAILPVTPLWNEQKAQGLSTASLLRKTSKTSCQLVSEAPLLTMVVCAPKKPDSEQDLETTQRMDADVLKASFCVVSRSCSLSGFLV